MLTRVIAVALMLSLRLPGQQSTELPPYVVSVPDSGAAGDGLVDDATAIQRAIDDSPFKSIIDFGDGKKYLIGRTIRLLPDRVYRGASTVLIANYAGPGTPMLRMNYGESHDMVLEGLTLDANRVGGILHLAVGGAADIPARNITIRNCAMLNNGNSGQVSESAIYTPVGLQSSLIAGNRFVNCSTCIHLTNPNQVTITDNEFVGTRGGNAISIVTYNFRFAYGEGLEITRNHGRDLMRMGIEIVGAEPNTRMDAPLIAENTFAEWNPRLGHDPFGISVAVGVKARILKNTLSGREGGYGIEVGSSGAVVDGNQVGGFYHGIVIQGQPDVVVSNNVISGQVNAGIMFSNAGPNPRARIAGNRIANPREFGIGMLPNDYEGSVIEDNIIEREGGRAGDGSGVSFIGIKLDAGSRAPATLSGNHIIQTGTSPPSGFSFIGIGHFAGAAPNVYIRNTIESRSLTPFGLGFLFWFRPYPGDSSITENEFINLKQITNGNMHIPNMPKRGRGQR